MVNPYTLNDELKRSGLRYKLWNGPMMIDGEKQTMYHLVIKGEKGNIKFLIPEKALDQINVGEPWGSFDDQGQNRGMIETVDSLGKIINQTPQCEETTE